jgi:hypothetical protein
VKVLGNDGLRNRYLEQAEAGRGTLDVTGPITSIEQSQMLKSGRLLLDRDNGASDGDSSFKVVPIPDGYAKTLRPNKGGHYPISSHRACTDIC